MKIAPGPKGHWLLGSLPEFRQGLLPVMQRSLPDYGNLARFQVAGLGLVYFVSHPDLAQEILVTNKQNFGKPGARGDEDGLRLVLGNGLLTNPDEPTWLRQRRMMQPIFHRKRIAAMGHKMTAAGGRMLTRWQQQYAPAQPVNLAREMMIVTLDIIRDTMFSETDNHADVDQIGDAVTTMARFATQRFRSPLRLPVNWPLPRHRAFLAAKALVDEIIFGLIQQRRATGERRDDLLDMLLAARDEETGTGMTDLQLRDEVITIYGAGHETTANALTWTWYLLTHHPDVLGSLQEEVDSICNGRLPTIDDLPNLPYTQMVFEESLRLYPPAPIVPRLCLQETAVTNGHITYTIEEGARVLISIANIHRHPDFWTDPDAFDPTRFHPDHKKGRHRLAHMPFGAGPRLCIGSNFAMIEGTLLLALIAQAYQITCLPAHPVEPEFAITLRPRYGLQVTLQPR